MRPFGPADVVRVTLLVLPILSACDSAKQEPATKPSAPPAGDNLNEAWCVTGRVTDAAGQPMSGVEIVAHCGEGTLRGTGHTMSDKDGQYTLRFGPGIWFNAPDQPAGVQAATISPHKPGYFEQNLHRQGDLAMADSPPPEKERATWGTRKIVLRNKPHRVDFVMVPAAEVHGRVLDERGQPLAGAVVALAGQELPPSSSVVSYTKTDADGAFTMTEVPTRTFWFSVREAGKSEARTEELNFDKAGKYEVDLTWNTSAEPPILRVIARP